MIDHPPSEEAWLRAWLFAAEVHKGQHMPGSDLPYLKHVGLVAIEVLVAHATEPVGDLALAVPCAILHDTIEDQGVTQAELAARFGPAVAAGVAALSKRAELPKADAMADSLTRIRQQPREVWCVKLADRISNLQPPPAYWSGDRIAAYRVEAGEILRALGEANGVLATRLRGKIDAYPKGK